MAQTHLTRRAGALGAVTLAALLATTPVVSEYRPAPAPAAAAVIPTISGGNIHTCAVYGGRVRCWGDNGNGQLGDGVPAPYPYSRTTPVDVIGLIGEPREVSAGGQHTCAVTTAGELSCWGLNGYGQLGDGTVQMRRTATRVVGISGAVNDVAAGSSFTCAVVGDGLFCWGGNQYGQLGDGTTEMRTTPVGVSGASSGVTAVSAGGAHACAIIAGAAKCWGDNRFGQLGDGTTVNRTQPVSVPGLSTGVTAIAAGYDHSCALTSVGGVKCWGDNFLGQIGDGTRIDRYSPVDVVGLAPATAITVGGSHSCAITTDGLKCWGWNLQGQLGDGATGDTGFVAVVGPARNAVAVAAGTNHTCAVMTTGELACWGYNFHGQLGDGTGGDAYPIRATPALVWDWRRTAIIGLDAGHPSGGRITARRGAFDLLIDDRWLQVPWPRYHESSGGVHPAFGDVDGDGLDEVVLGLTPTGFTSGWIAVLDDHAHGYALLQWLQVQWPEYNAASGETFPSAGDIDGDGKAEIVVGLGTGGGGWYEIFDDAAAGFAHVAWRRVNWWKYQRSEADGRTHPAVADLDGNGEAEIVLGLGPGSNGWLEVVNGASSTYSHRSWIQTQWVDYNAANGTTYPAAGDVDGDGKAEIVVGLGQGGGGWFEIFDDAGSTFAHLTWRRVPWLEYCAAAGELHPAVGQLDNDPAAEIVFGLAPHPGEGGWFLTLDDAATGYAFIGWRNVDWNEFRTAGGGTFPAIGRRR